MLQTGIFMVTTAGTCEAWNMKHFETLPSRKIICIGYLHRVFWEPARSWKMRVCGRVKHSMKILDEILDAHIPSGTGGRNATTILWNQNARIPLTPLATFPELWLPLWLPLLQLVSYYLSKADYPCFSLGSSGPWPISASLGYLRAELLQITFNAQDMCHNWIEP